MICSKTNNQLPAAIPLNLPLLDSIKHVATFYFTVISMPTAGNGKFLNSYNYFINYFTCDFFLCWIGQIENFKSQRGDKSWLLFSISWRVEWKSKGSKGLLQWIFYNITNMEVMRKYHLTVDHTWENSIAIELLNFTKKYCAVPSL